MTNDEAYALFERAGALLAGHFKLSSGLHSGHYLEKFRLMENPAYAEEMVAHIADAFRGDGIELVMGPTTAGIILAYAVARSLGVEARYAEKVDDVRQLRRGQVLAPGTRVLIVDDILTTGGSVRECVEVVQNSGAVVAGVGVLGDRSGGKVDFGSKLVSVLQMDVVAWQPDECPLCAQEIPIYMPGTNLKR